MTIQVWDYRAEYEIEREEILQAVDEVFRSGRLILGERVVRFESEFAGYCGLKHGVGVNSGTDALFLALKTLDIGLGDEVVTVSNTAVPTVSSICATGAKPRFVDIDPATYLMNVNLLEGAITSRTKCIIPVHLFGQCVPMEQVQVVAERHGVRVLEDCAQSHGAERLGVKAGAMSDLSAFSFYPTKILGGYGDGGMVCTNDANIAAKVKRLRMYGMDTPRRYSERYGLESGYYAEEAGYNSRLDEVQAAILLTKLPKIAQYLGARRSIANRYEALLGGIDLALPAVDPNNRHAYYLYVCRHPDRDFIVAELGRRGIAAKIDYPWPIHVMPAYSWLGYSEGDFPETERAAREIFSLPMYPSLREDEQDRVCGALREILASLPASGRV
jgi:dTDP-3-amino-2,3,6-trideoxy-4-keto-D-glucose/dTDP-3-amino-3,4,6-trideoxy-alpha-D-glucose/dTDP-2,6-dideoxy-D-kanosamine transaminase